jgi:hypothetical protein
MSQIINTYNLFINSDKRTTGTSSDFNLSLFKPIVLTNPNNFFTVRVGSAEVPYTFPLITNSNNSINFESTYNSTYFSTSFQITNGNYNILTLLDEVANKLQARLYVLYTQLFKFDFTYDRNAGKCTFSIAGAPATFSLSVRIFENSPVFMTCIGMKNSFLFSYTSPTVFTNATSIKNVNVSQNTALYLRSESFTQTTNSENIVEKSGVSDILAKIQITTQPQSYIMWTNPSDLEVNVSNRVIDIINLYLGSSTSYTLDLGDLDWSCRLTIHEKSYEPLKEQHNGLVKDMPSEIPNPLLEKRTALVENLKGLKEKLLSSEKVV